MTLTLRNSIVYFRDSFMPFSDATFSIASSPVLYGLTVYTVFSANWNKQAQKLYIFRLKEHYQRLRKSTKIMDFEDFEKTYSYEKFESLMHELLVQNEVKEDVLVRVMISIDELIPGTKIHGLKNCLSAYITPIGELLPQTGIHACISSWRRTPDNAIPSRAKINGSYINASLMKNEALLNGYDEAIALDEQGHVTEGTIANIFVIRANTLITPATSMDLLEGITRDSIIALAREKNITVEQRTVDRTELYIADEIFLCGSSARITPVLSVDRRIVGSGKPGRITELLQDTYDAIQHETMKNSFNWCTGVNM